MTDAIPGVPEQDYPIFSEAPETSFSCPGQGKRHKLLLYSRQTFELNFFNAEINVFGTFDVYSKLIYYQVIMLTLMHAAKSSTFAQTQLLANRVDSLSCALMELFSTKVKYINFILLKEFINLLPFSNSRVFRLRLAF